MYVQTIKRKNGSMKKLNSYRGLFLVPIMSLIFEKLIKSRIIPTLKQHLMSSMAWLKRCYSEKSKKSQ